jgi:hypothetical protein
LRCGATTTRVSYILQQRKSAYTDLAPGAVAIGYYVIIYTCIFPTDLLFWETWLDAGVIIPACMYDNQFSSMVRWVIWNIRIIFKQTNWGILTGCRCFHFVDCRKINVQNVLIVETGMVKMEFHYLIWKDVVHHRIHTIISKINLFCVFIYRNIKQNMKIKSFRSFNTYVQYINLFKLLEIKLENVEGNQQRNSLPAVFSWEGMNHSYLLTCRISATLRSIMH